MPVAGQASSQGFGNAPGKLEISVIIPTFNRLSSLPKAVDSVMAQTYPALEIIIVDDGSSDGTIDWLQGREHPVYFIQQENHGVSHARNRAIEKSSGNWIALLDSDDYWYPHKLERQVQAIEQSAHYRLCHCDEHWFRNGVRVNPKNKHRKSGGHIFEQCLPLCAISPSASLIQRTVFEDTGLFDESFPACEDYDLWLRITSREPVLYVDEPLLAKTGGHSDQLSSRYAAMDRFRLKALAKLLRNHSLNEQQRICVLKTFHSKFSIYCNGARKRGHLERAQKAEEQYSDILKLSHKQ